MRGLRVVGIFSFVSDCLNGLYSFGVILVIFCFFLGWMFVGYDSFFIMIFVNGFG